MFCMNKLANFAQYQSYILGVFVLYLQINNEKHKTNFTYFDSLSILFKKS